jgi:hypothetical protein
MPIALNLRSLRTARSVRTNTTKTRSRYTLWAVGRPWPTLTAIVAALILVVSAGAANLGLPVVEGPANDRVGLSTSTVWLPAAEGYRYLRAAREGGITWVREDFAWSTIEPSRGQFRWLRTDTLMRNAARLGIKVLAIAGYSPGWASGHNESDKYPPRSTADYARFVKAIADRYGRNGIFWRSQPKLTPSPVTAIELWNEPWLAAFWKPAPDASAYARLVRAAASAVKATRPGMTILVSGDVPEESTGVGVDWFKTLLLADPPLWQSRLVDAWSVHLYCHELSPWDATSTQRARFDRILLTRRLAQDALADKPIWITEFGWRTDPGQPDAVDEQTQARYMREALARVDTEWRSFVRRSFVFTWAKPSPTDEYNLLRPDGSSRPAWQAIQAFISRGA